MRPPPEEGPIEFEFVDALTLERMYYDRAQPVDAVPTHLPRWNVKCRDAGGGKGLAFGWHITGGGSTGAGKSLLGLNFSAAAMRAGEKVGYLSLEMSFDQLVTRILAIQTNTKTTKLEQGDEYDPEAFQAAAQAWEDKVPQMLGVNKDPIHTLDDIVWAMQELRTYHGVRVFVIDYLQLAWVLDAKTLLNQITEVSHRIRGIAKDHQLLTFGLSQFTREASKDFQNPPTVNSLYGGAPLENDSDQVVLLDHTSYNKQGENAATQKLLLAKNRHGPVGFMPIAWDYDTLRMYEVPDEGQYSDANDDAPF